MPAVRAEGAERDKDGPRRERRREVSEEGRVRPGRGRGRPGGGTWSSATDGAEEGVGRTNGLSRGFRVPSSTPVANYRRPSKNKYQ